MHKNFETKARNFQLQAVTKNPAKTGQTWSAKLPKKTENGFTKTTTAKTNTNAVVTVFPLATSTSRARPANIHQARATKTLPANTVQADTARARNTAQANTA